MDKRVMFWAGFVIILFIALTKTSLATSLFTLLVLGVIPGTDIVIPAWIILVTYPLILLLGIYWLSTQSLLIGEQAIPPKPVLKKTTAKRKSAKTATRAKRASAAKRHPRTAI